MSAGQHPGGPSHDDERPPDATAPVSPDEPADPPGDPAGPTDGDDGGRTGDRRLRTVAIVVAVGVGSAILGAAAVGTLGGDGRAGAAVLLLVLSLAFGAGAVVALGSAVVDEYRRRPVPGVRIVVGVVLFLVAAATMAMTAGIGG